MAYNGSPLHVDDGSYYRILERAGEVGATVFVHAENGEILDFLRRECIKKVRRLPNIIIFPGRRLRKRKESGGRHTWLEK